MPQYLIILSWEENEKVQEHRCGIVGKIELHDDHDEYILYYIVSEAYLGGREQELVERKTRKSNIEGFKKHKFKLRKFLNSRQFY